MSVQMDARLPMRKAVLEKIKAWMRESSVEEGSYLPSERELASQFRTSRVSVRQALEELEGQGWIERQAQRRPLVLAAWRGNLALTFAAPLREDGSHLGMIIHSESDAYAHLIIKNVFAAAKDMGIDLRITYASDFGAEALLKAGELKKDGCSSVIIPWVPKVFYGAIAEFVHRSPLPASIPVALPGLERNSFSHGAYGLATDLMVKAACRYFVSLGHGRIALLGPDSPGGDTMERHLMAYTRFICGARMQSVCGFAGPTARDMDAIAADWASFAGDLALVCYDDAHALRFMASMRKLGFSAPEDFAVIGCNDTPECLSADPPLSSFAFDYGEIASRLLGVAVSLATGRPAPASASKPPVLVVRRTCGGLALSQEALKASVSGLEIGLSLDKQP